ncbi:MAG: hypothetical protein KatS3mg118_3569 [Paracoccaceae bacterium]|nr:MAG: hypothetical protein KatS3mg118_3569 [Paracoccaceae bacterium]
MEAGAALITGAGRRLGRAMALDLARQGWDVAIHCNASEAEAVRVAAEARAHGVRAAVLQADLLDDGAVAGAGSRGGRGAGPPADAAGQQRIHLRTRQPGQRHRRKLAPATWVRT